MQFLREHQRQVHLDFHTSPHIDDVASEFDPRAFAETFRRAHVNSVTVFAKCHHGMCYYPARAGTPHPALRGRDLLGEQIEALHAAGIRCPIYFTVGWEEDAAQRHPDWRQLKADGTCARMTGDKDAPLPGGWWFMNLLHPEYLDYMEAQVTEILERYDVDGLFFDIVAFDRNACWSDASRAFREKQGLLATDAVTQRRFQTLAQAAFAERFSRLARGRAPQASLYYNSIHQDHRPDCSTRALASSYSHYEIESLPSGFWGYYHFPKVARWIMGLGKPWLGCTGRFQKMWGDFGGIKPVAALEFECFRSQALGGANSVGDQLPPRGRLEPAAYRLIAGVYEQCAAAEPFYAGSQALPQIGILLPGGARAELSVEGAVLLCEELHYESAVFDEASSFDKVELLILPDDVVPTPLLAQKIAAFRARGGKLLVSDASAFDAEQRTAYDLPLRHVGRSELYPTFWRTREEFAPGLAGSDRVIYERGACVEHDDAVESLIDRVLPYFQRTEHRFCSHRQTPPVADRSRYAAAVAGDGFVYFADPIFIEYRKTANLAVREALRRGIERLIGAAPFGATLPSTMQVVARRRNDDLLLTLLHYISCRKAIDIDVIDEPMGFAGETLRLPEHTRSVRVFDGDELTRTKDGAFELPVTKGRLLLEVPHFFDDR
jgi:hypothetical protein